MVGLGSCDHFWTQEGEGSRVWVTQTRCTVSYPFFEITVLWFPGLPRCHSGKESACLGAWLSGQSVRTPVRKRTLNTVKWRASLLVSGFLRSSQAEPSTSPVAQRAGVLGISLGPPEMLQKQVIEKLSTTLGELESSGLLCWRAQRS